MEAKDKLNIEKSVYQGYLWWSDANSPCVLNEEEFSRELKKENPYVVEGFLLDCKNHKSIMIRNIDGKYFSTEYDLEELKEIPSSQKEQIEYLANFPESEIKLIFEQIWRPVADDRNYGFKVLEPAELVFKGFKK